MNAPFRERKKNVAKCILHLFLVIKKIYSQSRDNKDSNERKQMGISINRNKAILNGKCMSLIAVIGHSKMLMEN